MARKNKKSIKLWPFTRRGARLHRAIFRILGDKQPQTTRQVGKNIISFPRLKGTSLSTVNKSVRNLQQHSYLNKTEIKERVGGITNYYELTPNTYLAMYMEINSKDDLFEDISGEAALIILADLIYANIEKNHDSILSLKKKSGCI